MQTEVETATEDATVLDVARTLDEPTVEAVVIVDGDAVVGTVTKSDAVSLLADERDPAAVTAAEVMASPVHTVHVDESIVTAAERLREHRIRVLPVLDDADELVGIVTTALLSQYIPHVRRPATDVHANDDVVHQTERQDTAYEKTDWEFEYVGHQGQIDIGDVIRFSKPLDEAEVDEFADASGDTNRLHLDEEYANGTRFGRRIVHGTLVAGVISAALARLPGLIIYLSQEIGYLGPVDLSERVTAECEVLEEVGEQRYRLTTTVSDSDGETVIDGEAVVISDPIPDTA